MGITIYMPRPKRLATWWAKGGADILNIIKGPMDSWQGVLFFNDDQIIAFHRLEKVYAKEGKEPGIQVDIRYIHQ